jgi:hypothetical protein
MKTAIQHIGMVISLMAIFLMPFELNAQVTARAMGMGGAYTAVARGVHAADWNPANLGFPNNPKFSMSIISVGVEVSNNAFTKAMYDKYSQREVWNESDKADIYSSIPDRGFEAGVAATIRMISFSVGKFALTLGGDLGGYGTIEKSLFDILLNGNRIGKNYQFDDFNVDALTVARLGLSYGEQIPVEFAEIFTIGGSFNLLYGIQYTKLEQADFNLKFNEFDFAMDGIYEARMAMGKLGWGLTLGSAAQLNDRLSVGVRLDNILSHLGWDKHVKQSYGILNGDSLVLGDLDDSVEDSSWTQDGQAFSSQLPFRICMGAKYKEGDFIMTADYVQGFRNTGWARTRPQLNIGTEWRKVPWLPLRLGVLLGGRLGYGSSFGLGLRPAGFVWDIAIMNRGFITSGSSKGLLISTEFGLEL